MSKKVKAKTKAGQKLWILVPSIAINSYAMNPQKVSYLELFYFFAQFLTKTKKKKLTKEEEKRFLETNNRVLIELDNKISALKYFVREITKQEKELLSRREKNKRIYDYKPYQKFLALIESYLNTVHSIFDYIRTIDKLLRRRFAKDIEKEEWFKIEIDLRNVFHHNQSPHLRIEKRKIILAFNRLPRDPRYFVSEMKNARGYYEVEAVAKNIGQDMISFLNNWAKKYLDLIDVTERIQVIRGFHSDGRMKYKEVSLKELLKIARISHERHSKTKGG